MAWTKFEISRLNYNVCGFLILISLIQNGIFYYLLYEFNIYGSDWFFSFSLATLIITKLVWLFGLEYEIIKYTPTGAHHYWSILLIDLLPIVLFRFRYAWSMTFRRYFYASISHSFIVAIPMSIINTVYLINYPRNAPFKVSLLSILLTSISVPLVFVGHGGCIPTKANLFHLICLLLDTFKGFLTVFFISNWIYYNRYKYEGPSQAFWETIVIDSVSVLYVIKTFICSPLYAIFLFIWYGFNSVPNCSNITWNLLLIIFLPIPMIFVWLFVDTIFFSYPLLIFYHNAYEYQFELWFNVITFLHKKVNKYDYTVRLWLFNYLWLIQRIYSKEEDPNQMYTPTAFNNDHRHSSISDHDDNDDDNDDNDNENIFEFNKQNTSNELMLNTPNKSKSIHSMKSIRRISKRNLKYLSLLQKVEKTLIWYLTPKTEEEQKMEDRKYMDLTPKQKAKQIELEWKEKFNLNIFLSKGDNMFIVLYEGYDELMNDILMKYFDLRQLVGTDYDKVTQINDKEHKCFNLFRYIMENMFIYFVGPIQLCLAIYGAIIYPIILSVVLGIQYNESAQHERGLFWFIKSYYIIIIIMLIFLPSFLEMVRCLWYTLYSRAGTWQETPDKYLSNIYDYIHLNRQRIDIIQQTFIDDKQIAIHIFQYLGYSAIQYDGINDYIIPNAPDLLDKITDVGEDTDYQQLIHSSLKIISDPNHQMILNIQQRQHTVDFTQCLSIKYEATDNITS